MWPAISRLLSVVAISGKREDKTWGWLLPLLNLLQDKFVHDQLPPGKALVLGKREDKTWGWLLPLLNLLHDKFVHDQLPPGIALILGKREDKT